MPFDSSFNEQRPLRLFRRGSRAFVGAGVLALLLLGCGLLGAAWRAQNPEQLRAQGYVNDFANVLSQSARDQLTALCTEVEQKDRGVLILFAIDDHKYWTEVGYGLEGILPDGKVGSFGREAVPLLRANN